MKFFKYDELKIRSFEELMRFLKNSFDNNLFNQSKDNYFYNKIHFNDYYLKYFNNFTGDTYFKRNKQICIKCVENCINLPNGVYTLFNQVHFDYTKTPKGSEDKNSNNESK